MAIHDLQHRIHPNFLRFRGRRMGSPRVPLLDGVRYAEAILVDSEIGREDVLEFYGGSISAERVGVLPFVPPPYLQRPSPDVVEAQLAGIGVHRPYLLFPAQLWPHKNHRRVMEAVAHLHHDGIDVTVVLRVRVRTITRTGAR